MKSSATAIAASPTSGYVYVAHANNDTISVLSGTQVIKTLPTGDYPFDIAVNPVDGWVYVSNYYGRSLTVIADPTPPKPALIVTKQADLSPARAGDSLTYTLRVTNTGNVTLHATITDILPLHIMPGITPSGSLVLPGGTLVWQPVILAPNDIWMQTVAATVEVGYVETLTNIVQAAAVEGASSVYTETVTVLGRRIYLPLVLRNH